MLRALWGIGASVRIDPIIFCIEESDIELKLGRNAHTRDDTQEKFDEKKIDDRTFRVRGHIEYIRWVYQSVYLYIHTYNSKDKNSIAIISYNIFAKWCNNCANTWKNDSLSRSSETSAFFTSCIRLEVMFGSKCKSVFKHVCFTYLFVFLDFPFSKNWWWSFQSVAQYIKILIRHLLSNHYWQFAVLQRVRPRAV